MHYQDLIDQYLAGPDLLQRAVQGMNEEQLDAKPIAGKWSTRQVVCHLADFEPIYADRMKRVIAEQCPTFFGGDPDTFAAHLAYEHRSIDSELTLLTAIRHHTAAILARAEGRRLSVPRQPRGSRPHDTRGFIAQHRQSRTAPY